MKALVLAAALGVAATGALAQQRCADHATVIDHHKKQWDETVRAQGITTGGDAFFELLLSEDGSWSIIVTGRDGRTCFVAGGDNWADVPPPPEDDPA